MLAVFHQGERDPDQCASQGNIGFGGLHSATPEPIQVRPETEVPGGSGRIENQSPIFAVALLGELALAGELSGIPDNCDTKSHDEEFPPGMDGTARGTG